MEKIRKTIEALFLLVAVALLALPAVAASSNPQLVVSSTNSSGTGALKPFGFWIWCQAATASNSYKGQCAGTMYFYPTALSPVSEVGNPTFDATSFSITVHSVSGVSPSFQCSLSGPVGHLVTVDVTCTATSARPGAGTMPNTSVTVTS